MKLIYFFLLIVSASCNADAFQIDKTLTLKTGQQNKEKDGAARRLIAVQPDFTANASCVNYQDLLGHGFGESVKAAKKGDWYRHQSATFIDYFAPDAPPVRYSLKTKKYDAFTGDVENHLWFTNVESPALLALDKTLKFEIVGSETIDFEIVGKTEKRELIKIKVTGETEVGGDWDKAVAFLYVAPDLKNLVVKTELIFPKGGRICTLSDVSFDVPDGIFAEFIRYRRRPYGKYLTLPKPSDVAQLEFNDSSNRDSLYFTGRSLLEALPRFVPDGGYQAKWILYQTGTITLKDGTVLHWSANNANSLILKHDYQERYYVLPPEVKK